MTASIATWLEQVAIAHRIRGYYHDPAYSFAGTTMTAQINLRRAARSNRGVSDIKPVHIAAAGD
jgi:hypothetical protein